MHFYIYVYVHEAPLLMYWNHFVAIYVDILLKEMH